MLAPPTADIIQRDTVRLIASGRLKEAALAPLAHTSKALEDLAALESLTNERLQAQSFGLAALDPRELAFGRAGHTLINAAFTHTRPGGNRFNDESRGAWYCGFSVETALAEVSFHLTRELTAIDHFENVTEFSELLADFFGPFHDLRAAPPQSDALLNVDPDAAYPAGQSFARFLRLELASNGIVYPSVRHAGGTCLVAFRPDLVLNLRQGGLIRLEWRGDASPSVTRLS